MRHWCGLGGRIIAAIQDRAERKRLAAPVPIGDFYRAGGNNRLYDGLPRGQHYVVIHAGEYNGEWTAEMLTRYGCIASYLKPYRPSPSSAVNVINTTLASTSTRPRWAAATTSHSPVSPEFQRPAEAIQSEARVQAISDALPTLNAAQLIHPGAGAVGVLKLNIEGGKHEVLGSLLVTGDITRMSLSVDSVLPAFGG